jgi:beta-lactamase superfamily II metal-dependent hydrolase
MKVLITFIALFIAYTASADYLIIQRNGNMRADASTESEVVERVHTGDTLLLLEPDQTNMYYHVRALQSGQEGWIYRTLARKVAGNIGGETIPADNNTVADIRVLDVGAGHCALIKLPGDKYVIYDAGSDAKLNGNRTIEQIREYIPAGSKIELMVLSHCDADHINAAGQVVRDYNVKKVLWTGFEASMTGGTQTGAYKRLVTMLAAKPGTENVNLHERDSVITPGNHLQIGNAKFTFLCGFGSPPAEWQGLDKAEKLNGVSIVMKMEFGGNSILFTGDAVGRHRDDPEDALIATEKFMVENAATYLPSTILIAPHHGARNGSSTAFVNLVRPKWVIFPAGHQHLHPTSRTANLYLQFTSKDSMARTDRGDDEGTGEWTYLRRAHCKDDYNDDTIQVQLRSNGTYRVYYMTPDGPCRP